MGGMEENKNKSLRGLLWTNKQHKKQIYQIKKNTKKLVKQIENQLIETKVLRNNDFRIRN
jgi:hypothetical protein